MGVIRTQALEMRYGGGKVAALSDLSVEIGEGVTGLVGANGAGKTSCIDALTGFQDLHGGHVRFAGRSLQGVPPHQRARRGFVRTFQSLELFDDLTVHENLLAAASVPSWFSTFTDALWPKRHDRASTDATVDLLAIGHLVDRLPEILSDRIHAPGPGRLPSTMAPGELEGRLAFAGRVPSSAISLTLRVGYYPNGGRVNGNDYDGSPSTSLEFVGLPVPGSS